MDSSSLQTILILAANPLRSPRLRLDQEVREIQEALRRSGRKFDVKQQWATRATDIRRALLDHRPAVVHFSGHGAGTDGIALEDEAGESKLVAADALAGLFALFSQTITCVVLNACYSSVQAVVIANYID